MVEIHVDPGISDPDKYIIESHELSAQQQHPVWHYPQLARQD
jgi:hypothetical protein